MGAVAAKPESSRQVWLSETKLEAKMVDAMKQRASLGSSLKSFNGIILKFPKIDECFRNCKTMFEQFDEDKNGVIDHEELKGCFHKLQISFTEDEINDLFEACDINEDMGMNFNEFVVLLCLVYLLKDDPSAAKSVSKQQYLSCFSWQISRMRMPDMEVTFESLVDAFVFLDKNKDGYVSKNEMVEAINETASGERSSGQIALKRFEEMDWDKNGMVNFKEYLFAFTRWVGIDEEDDNDNNDDDNDDDKV